MTDPTKNHSYNITIQCALDGFCFVIHDIEENKIVDIELYQTSDSGDDSIIMDAIRIVLIIIVGFIVFVMMLYRYNVISL